MFLTRILSAFGGWVGFTGWLISLLGFLFGVWVYHDTKTVSQIHYGLSSASVFVAPEHFRTQVHIDGSPLPDSERQLTQMMVTVWSSGNVSINGADVRVPLTISGGNDARFLASHIVQTRTAIGQQFHLVPHAPSSVEIRWKLLDPDMAVKVAILHTGPANSVTVSGNFGPGTKVTSFRPSAILGLLGVAFPIGVGIIAGVLIGRGAVYLENRRVPKWAALTLMAVALFCASAGVGLFGFRLISPIIHRVRLQAANRLRTDLDREADLLHPIP